jgi:hypothetical protein
MIRDSNSRFEQDKLIIASFGSDCRIGVQFFSFLDQNTSVI